MGLVLIFKLLMNLVVLLSLAAKKILALALEKKWKKNLLPCNQQVNLVLFIQLRAKLNFCDAPFEAECSAEQPTEKPNSPIPNSPNTASFSPNTVSFSPNTVSNSPNSPNSPNTVTFSPNTVTFSPNTFSQVDDDDDDSSDAPLLMWGCGLVLLVIFSL